MLQAVWPTLAGVKPLQASPPQWDKSRVTLMQEHRVQSISSSRRGSPGRPTSARVERVFVRRTPIGAATEASQRIMACKCFPTGACSACQASFGLKAASCTSPALGLLAVGRRRSLPFSEGPAPGSPPSLACFLIKVSTRTFPCPNTLGCVMPSSSVSPSAGSS